MKADRLGIALSTGCMLHCLLPPLLVMVPSAAVLHATTETYVHWLLLGIALPVSGLSLLNGARRHGRRWVLGMGTAGLTLLLLGASQFLGEGSEVPLTLAGAGSLIMAHLVNLHDLASGG
jgi:hypothetical protein